MQLQIPVSEGRTGDYLVLSRMELIFLVADTVLWFWMQYDNNAANTML